MSGLAHDLRAPLGNLVGEPDLILDQYLPSSARDGLDAAMAIAQGLLDAFEDMVTLEGGDDRESGADAMDHMEGEHGSMGSGHR